MSVYRKSSENVSKPHLKCAILHFKTFGKKFVTQGLTLTTENCFKKASLKFQQFKEENGHEIQSYKIIYSFTMINPIKLYIILQ